MTRRSQYSLVKGLPSVQQSRVDLSIIYPYCFTSVLLFNFFMLHVCLCVSSGIKTQEADLDPYICHEFGDLPGQTESELPVCVKKNLQLQHIPENYGMYLKQSHKQLWMFREVWLLKKYDGRGKQIKWSWMCHHIVPIVCVPDDLSEYFNEEFLPTFIGELPPNHLIT